MQRRYWIDMDTLLADLRYAFRTLLKSPGFTLAAILMLALGIGANTAIFSAVDNVLLRPAPYKNADRVVMLWEKRAKEGSMEGLIAPADFFDWRSQSSTLDHVAAVESDHFNLTGSGAPVALRGARVTSGFFEALGVQPALGRTIRENEEHAGEDHSVLLSHDLWKSKFNADPGIVGRTLEIDGHASTVVGVLPEHFRFPLGSECQLFAPMSFTSEVRKQRSLHWLSAMAELKPGVNIATAQADMNVVAGRLEKQYVENAGHGINIVPLHHQLTGEVRPALILLLAGAGLVLLIACSNVANLVLARSVGRRKEIGIRLALGSTRIRVIRQLLIEAGVLSAAAAVLGVFVAVWGIDAARASFFSNLEQFAIAGLDRIHVDARVLAFTIVLAFIAPCLFAIIPAWMASGKYSGSPLRESGRGASFASRRRFRSALIVVEVALSMIMLIGSGLLLKSYWTLMHVDTGFRAEHLTVAEVDLPEMKYKTADQANAFFGRLLARLGELPPVRSAGFSQAVPFTPGDWRTGIVLKDRAERAGERLRMHPRFVSDQYLQTLGIAIKTGRGLLPTDTKDRPAVAVLSETAAHRYWPNDNPVGKQFSFNDDQKRWIEVVGVGADVKDRELNREATPDVYIHYVQIPLPVTLRSQRVVIRTSEDLATVAPLIRSAVATIDQDQPVSEIRSMDSYIDNSVAPRRFNLVLLAFLTAVALTLSAAGLYSVMAYFVTERTGEIGIRVALGAKRSDVLRLVLVQGLILAASGVVIGLAISAMVPRLLTTMLYGITPHDPVIFSVAPVLLMITALAANYIPAVRATKVDPIFALRAE
jgi:putative ABC transport system permease protein